MEDDLARYMYSEPIEEYVAGLATDEDLPVAGIEACTARYDEAGPLLRAAISRAADATLADANDERLFARALFIAGLRRDPSACEPLLRALRQPQDDVALDDAVVEFLPRIVAGVFDGNAEALFEAIADQRLDQFVREKLFGAATFLTWEGRIERERMERFLERFEAEGPVPDEDYGWVGWLTAVSLLGLRRLEPNAARVLGKEMLSDFMSREELAAELADAERTPRDSTRVDKADLGYIDSTDDILEALAWFADADEPWDEYSPLANEDEEPAPDQPVVNPWRHVGRNDPCPCGSGKKAKRCCLAA